MNEAKLAIKLDEKTKVTDKRILFYITRLVEISHMNSSLVIQTTLAADYVFKKTEIIESIFKNIIEKTKICLQKQSLKSYNKYQNN